MNKSHISIQHIQQDLNAISSLLTNKISESIFVDIYSNDPITLKTSKDYVSKVLLSAKENEITVIENTKSYENYLNNETTVTYSSEAEEPLTNYSVFDNMSAEILRLNRNKYILDWYGKVKGLVINPVTMVLINRGRLLFNLLLLAVTIMAFRTIPQNDLVQYFIGPSSPVFYAIWLPYLVVLYFDFKYISRLYLLISEMYRRSISTDLEVKNNNIVLLSPSLVLSEQELATLLHGIRERDAHLIRFTDAKQGMDHADLVFKVPNPKEAQLLKYIGVLSGLNETSQTEGPVSISKVDYQPIGAGVLESFSSSGLLKNYTPSTCHKLVVNFEYMASRFHLNEEEKNEVAHILLHKFAAKTQDGSIGFEAGEGSKGARLINDRIQNYL